MENHPAPTRASKRIKLARAAQEKLRPRSNETLAALPKSTFLHSVVSALPARDESFFSLGEEKTRRGPVAKEVRKGGNEATETEVRKEKNVITSDFDQRENLVF